LEEVLKISEELGRTLTVHNVSDYSINDIKLPEIGVEE